MTGNRPILYFGLNYSVSLHIKICASTSKLTFSLPKTAAVMCLRALKLYLPFIPNILYCRASGVVISFLIMRRKTSLPFTPPNVPKKWTLGKKSTGLQQNKSSECYHHNFFYTQIEIVRQIHGK